MRAPFARQLEHHVAAHGKPHQVKFRETLSCAQMFRHRADVAGEAGVVERRRQVLRIPAVAHVHPHDIEAGTPGFLGGAPHVVRLAGTFQAVHQQKRGTGNAPGLPVDVQPQPHFRRNFNQARFGIRQGRKATRPQRSGESHEMTVAEEPRRHKTGGFEAYRLSLR